MAGRGSDIFEFHDINCMHAEIDRLRAWLEAIKGPDDMGSYERTLMVERALRGEAAPRG